MPRFDGDGYAADMDHLTDFDLGPDENDLEEMPVPERTRPPIARPAARIKTPTKDNEQ